MAIFINPDTNETMLDPVNTGKTGFIPIQAWQPGGGAESSDSKVSGVTSINTNDAISDLNKDKEKLDKLSENSPKFVDPGYAKKDATSPGTDWTGMPLITDESTKTKQDTTKETKIEGSNLTLQEAHELFGNDFTGITKNADGTFTPDKSAYERIGITGMTEGGDTQLESDLQTLDNTITKLTNDFLSYNVLNDPDYQAEVQGITAQYDKMRSEMSNINNSRKQALQTLGYRTGSTQYAGAVQLGIVGEEIKQGNERISEITRQENAAKSAAKKAFEDGKYAKFAQQMDALDTLRDNKAEELKRYNDKLAEANKLLQEQADREFEVTKWLTDQDWKEKQFGLDTAKFYQSAEESAAKLDLDYEKLGFDKQKFNQEFKFELGKFQEEVRQFGEKNSLDRLKFEVEQANNDFDRQIKFQTLLGTIPEGEEITVGGLTGVGRKSNDLTIDQQLKLEKDGYYIDDNGVVKQKPTDQATIDSAQEEVDNVKDILNHPGLNESVGPNPFARGTFNWNEWINSNSANFVAGVEQLISQKSLSSLIAAKAKGATFGALSDTEMAILTKAATELGALRKYQDDDPTKEVIGYKTTEKNFKRIMGKIQSSAQNIIDYAKQEKMETGQISPSQIIDDYYKENADKRDYIDSLEFETNDDGEPLSDEEKLKILGISFNQVGSDTNKATGNIKTTNIGGRNIKVDSSIANKLAMADAEFFKETGKHLQINQSYRTREQQAELYRRSQAGEIGRAAPPGKSFHETGLAVDVTNWKEAEKYLRKYGFKNNLADDKGHFSVGEFA